MKTLLVATTALCVALVAFTEAAAGQLYAVRPVDGASLSAVEEIGAVVRHVGLAEMIVEGDELVGDALTARGRVARRLPGPRATDTLFLCYARTSVDRLSRLGDIIWSESGGAVIVSSAPEYLDELRVESFMVVPASRVRRRGLLVRQRASRPRRRADGIGRAGGAWCRARRHIVDLTRLADGTRRGAVGAPRTESRGRGSCSGTSASRTPGRT